VAIPRIGEKKKKDRKSKNYRYEEFFTYAISSSKILRSFRVNELRMKERLLLLLFTHEKLLHPQLVNIE